MAFAAPAVTQKRGALHKTHAFKASGSRVQRAAGVAGTSSRHYERGPPLYQQQNKGRGKGVKGQTASHGQVAKSKKAPPSNKLTNDKTRPLVDQTDMPKDEAPQQTRQMPAETTKGVDAEQPLPEKDAVIVNTLAVSGGQNSTSEPAVVASSSLPSRPKQEAVSQKKPVRAETPEDYWPFGRPGGGAPRRPYLSQADKASYADQSPQTQTNTARTEKNSSTTGQYQRQEPSSQNDTTLRTDLEQLNRSEPEPDPRLPPIGNQRQRFTTTQPRHQESDAYKMALREQMEERKRQKEEERKRLERLEQEDNERVQREQEELLQRFEIEREQKKRKKRPAAVNSTKVKALATEVEELKGQGIIRQCQNIPRTPPGKSSAQSTVEHREMTTQAKASPTKALPGQAVSIAGVDKSPSKALPRQSRIPVLKGQAGLAKVVRQPEGHHTVWAHPEEKKPVDDPTKSQASKNAQQAVAAAAGSSGESGFKKKTIAKTTTSGPVRQPQKHSKEQPRHVDKKPCASNSGQTQAPKKLKQADAVAPATSPEEQHASLTANPITVTDAKPSKPIDYQRLEQVTGPPAELNAAVQFLPVLLNTHSAKVISIPRNEPIRGIPVQQAQHPSVPQSTAQAFYLLGQAKEQLLHKSSNVGHRIERDLKSAERYFGKRRQDLLHRQDQSTMDKT